MSIATTVSVRRIGKIQRARLGSEDWSGSGVATTDVVSAGFTFTGGLVVGAIGEGPGLDSLPSLLESLPNLIDYCIPQWRHAILRGGPHEIKHNARNAWIRAKKSDSNVS